MQVCKGGEEKKRSSNILFTIGKKPPIIRSKTTFEGF